MSSPSRGDGAVRPSDPSAQDMGDVVTSRPPIVEVGAWSARAGRDTVASVHDGAGGLTPGNGQVFIHSTKRALALSVAGLLFSFPLLGCSSYVLREEPYRGEVLRLVAAQPTEYVADIGCQDGFWSYELAREVGPRGKVYALDIEQEWIDHVSEESRKRGLTQVEPVLCRPDDTTLDDESVAIVFLSNTIHHIDDLPAYTEHLYRILKPGGRYVVIDNSTGRFGHSSDPEEICRITTDAGFVAGDLNRFAGTKRYLIVFTKRNEWNRHASRVHGIRAGRGI